jgi:diguanylate cyclase (GGDEF)-like protein/putative nucleotidyltransferase with HDIG domain
VTPSIRADLTLGIAYGLAASALLWALLLVPPAVGGSDWLVLALGAAAGTLVTAFPRVPRVVATYSVAVAALLVSGPAVSCLAGALGVFAARMRNSRATRRQLLSRIGFRASREVLALGLAAAGFAAAGGQGGRAAGLVSLAAHAAVYATVRACLVELVAAGVGRRARPRTAFRNTISALPACAVGVAVGSAAAVAFAQPAARPLLLAVVLLLAVWAVHRLHRDRQATVRRHACSLETLRREVARALARTMEERDPSTQDHLHRVHRLCVGIATHMNLSDAEVETLASAALLHDIGKVSVPEHILTKPGRLTAEEMERVKRHPVVGAEIVQALPFRQSLAPIVRHHHERWDGCGYPDGLRGREIPVGARILSAVDCYDALTTDRPYRGALSHGEAVSFMSCESGRTFDPDVIDALLDYLEARGSHTTEKTGAMVRVANVSPADEGTSPGRSLATAQRELETLYDISRAMGYGLNLEEFLTLAGCRLSSLVRYQSLVAYFVDEDSALLRARFAVGRAADKLRLMTIPLGERLSGWAALQQRAVLGRDHVTPLERDGSRSDLEDWADDPEVAGLGATLAAPMVAEAGLLGVVTLYDEIDRGFTDDDRRILTRVAGCIAKVAALEGSESSVAQTSLTDPLTGVPNARFLWLESAHRMTGQGDGFGLVAFRVGGLDHVGEGSGNEAVDRLLCEVARRFAASCRRSETLVRFGHDLFVVLSPVDASGELVRRWHELAGAVERPPLVGDDGRAQTIRLTVAHASYPADAEGLDTLLDVLDQRLVVAASRGRTVLPFRAPDRASAGGEAPP